MDDSFELRLRRWTAKGVLWIVLGLWSLAQIIWGEEISAWIKSVIPDDFHSPAEALRLFLAYAPPIILVSVGLYLLGLNLLRRWRQPAPTDQTVPNQETKIDYSKWDSVDHWTIWQAAFAWIDLEPQTPIIASTEGSVCYEVWARLREAALTGQIENVMTSESGVMTATRKALLNYANEQKERPNFLHPEDRVRRKFVFIHGRPWGQY